MRGLYRMEPGWIQINLHWQCSDKFSVILVQMNWISQFFYTQKSLSVPNQFRTKRFQSGVFHRATPLACLYHVTINPGINSRWPDYCHKNRQLIYFSPKPAVFIFHPSQSCPSLQWHYSLFTVIDATKSLSNNGGHKLLKFRHYKNFDEMSS